MRSLFLSLPFLLLFATPAIAQNQTISIQGNIDSAVLSNFNTRELLIKVHHSAQKLNNQELILKVPIDPKGRFSYKFSPPSKVFYLSFWSVNHNFSNGAMLPIHFPARQSLLEELYLFKETDSIHLFIGKDGHLRFRGRGADKLNCQHQLYAISSLPESFASRNRELLRQGKYLEMLELQEEVIKATLELRQKLLDSYRTQLSPNTYQMLRLDMEGIAKHELMADLWKLSRSVKQEIAVKAMQDYFNRHILQESTKPIDSAGVAQSPYFTDYLFKKEWNAHKLFSTNFEKGTSFQSVYNRLLRNYSGRLRDELLMTCTKNLNKDFNAEIRSKIDEMILSVEAPAYHKALQDWKKNQGMAYPFELKDAKGKSHKLLDYQGKVVVIDFWFTGCTWCIQLNAAMHSIIEKYQNNPKVVFLTICEDVKKESWLKSLASGKYSSPGTIDLYTNGMGTIHPMLAYYDYVGAPQQLIIGPNGDVISSRPPRPDKGMNYTYQKDAQDGRLKPDSKATLANPSAIAFMKLIDEQIQKTAAGNIPD